MRITLMPTTATILMFSFQSLCYKETFKKTICMVNAICNKEAY